MRLRLLLDALQAHARALLVAFFSIGSAACAQAGVGMDVLPAAAGAGPVTLFYPSASPSAPVERGSSALDVALKGTPAPGNGGLIVLSHGSGGSPWPQSDLARALAQAGFVVAAPEHRGDNFHDLSKAGPESWKLRPAEVSHAIDAVQADPRFAALLAPNKVGVYGMSAGGLTALVLAGGRWSPALFARHCEAHIQDDFPACVGLLTRLEGNWLDRIRTTVAKTVLRYRFDDADWASHADPRVRAVVAAVPLAAVFDPQSLARPRVPVALIEAENDRWLAPRFHSRAVLAVCARCQVLAALPGAGHGAMLSPFPRDLDPDAARLLDDPPGFDRRHVADANRAIVAFFLDHLKP